MRRCLFYISLLLSVIGCKEVVTLEYEDDPRLYFYNINSGQHDSISQTFFVLPSTQMEDTVEVDIRTMGYPTDYDRPVVLVQTNAGEPDAAVPGKHYVPFDDARVKDKFRIAAGEVKCIIPVIFLKDPSLETSKVRLELAFAETKDFKPGIDAWSTFVITSTAEASEPSNWSTQWRYIFGTWGAVKMKFIVEYVGFSAFDEQLMDMGYRNYLTTKAAQKLFDYNHSGAPDTPLTETDGTLVAF